MKQLFSSTLVAVMVIACCYGSVSALEAPDMRASLTLTDNETLRFRLINGLELTESIERTKR